MNKGIIMKKVVLTAVAAVSFASVAEARPFRVGQIPNGLMVAPPNGCQSCHMSPQGADARNNFGMAVENTLDPPGPTGVVQWTAALASADSDGDGVSNGQELGDPLGTWQMGQVDPPGPVSNPGDPNDTIALPDAGVMDAGQTPDAGVDAGTQMPMGDDDDGGCQNVSGPSLTWLFFAAGLFVWIGRRRTRRA